MANNYEITVKELKAILFESNETNQDLTIRELRKKLFDEPNQDRKACEFLHNKKQKNNGEGFSFDFFHNNERIYGLSKSIYDGIDNIYIDQDKNKLLLLKEAMEKAIKTIDLFIKK